MGLKRTNEPMVVSVQVHPALREYLVCIHNGEDTIFPEKGTRLWGLVSMHLTVQPSTYSPAPEGGSRVNIAIFNSHAQTWCMDRKRTIYQDTLFRNHLSPKGQRAVARHLMDDFKQTFRAYMTGAISNNSQLSITEAIDEFCSDYSISTEQMTYDMLRKDWYRFRLKSQNGEKPPGSWQK
ncbi:MAG: hypothetical protein E7113_06985 [Bacteroidales bacterium]|nr:hypothetical protein [Bacteroidales bacterium]